MEREREEERESDPDGDAGRPRAGLAIGVERFKAYPPINPNSLQDVNERTGFVLLLF